MISMNNILLFITIEVAHNMELYYKVEYLLYSDLLKMIDL
jgi:hypothetical protein